MSSAAPALSSIVQRRGQTRQAVQQTNTDLEVEHPMPHWSQQESEVLSSLFGIFGTANDARTPAGPYRASASNEQFTQTVQPPRLQATTMKQGEREHKRRQLNRSTSSNTIPPSQTTMSIPVQTYEPRAYVSQQVQLASVSDLVMPPQTSSTFAHTQFLTPTSPMSLTDASTIDGTMSRTTSLDGGLEMLRIHSSSNSSSFPSAEEECFGGSFFPQLKSDDMAAFNHSQSFGNVDLDASFAGHMFDRQSTHAPFMSATSSMNSQQSFGQLDAIMETQEPIPLNLQSSSASFIGDLKQSEGTHYTQPHQSILRDRSDNKRSNSSVVFDRQTPSSQNSRQHVTHLMEIEDGPRIRSVASIPRTPYKRPAKEKQYCTKCNDHPEGFRGDHELARHVQRQHSTIRKAWIAVDKSEDGRMLSNCKHCRNQKKYYAHYNLAAHLRRIHFNKKDKTGPNRRRRGVPIPDAEKRGGRSGGSEPSIDVLFEQGWIKEVQEFVPNDSPDAINMNDDDENSCSEEVDMSFDPSFTAPNVGYQPAFADVNWQPTLSSADLSAAQAYLTGGLALARDGTNLPNTYTTGGSGMYGQDSCCYDPFATQQQDYPTAFPYSYSHMQH